MPPVDVTPKGTPMRAFLTGSRVYGKPNEKSDVDLVILVDFKALVVLEEFSESKKSIRFGKLNIIACQSEEEMAVWRVGTSKMMIDAHRRENTRCRKAAKACLDVLRRAVGIFDRSQSGGDDNEAEFIEEV